MGSFFNREKTHVAHVAGSQHNGVYILMLPELWEHSKQDPPTATDCSGLNASESMSDLHSVGCSILKYIVTSGSKIFCVCSLLV